MVSLIRQLQLIGIKTNLESFAITILMEHMLTRNQLPLFLWVSKQWGMNDIGTRTTRTETYPLPYSEFCLPIVSGKGYSGGLNYGFGIGMSSYSLTSVTVANNSEESSYRWTGYTYVVIGA